MDYIKVKGARENNLKNIDVEIPKNKLVVMSGLSGSGKSSLAFNTIYAEGQRRYVESLSAYARQFLGNVQKPDVDQIDGLSPAISIDQKTTSNNPRSTVGTVTEIYDYLRLLYARVGVSYCPTHGVEITSQTIENMLDDIKTFSEDSKVIIYAPIVTLEKGTHKKTLEDMVKKGYSRALVNGEVLELDTEINLDKNKKHSISIIVDRLKLNEKNYSRIYESLETAANLADGFVEVDINGELKKYSEKYSCPHCDFTLKEIEPRLFSFNAPFGSCPDCKGLGTITTLNEELVFDEEKTMFNGGLKPWGDEVDKLSIFGQEIMITMDAYKIKHDKLIKDYTDKEREVLFYGSGTKQLDFSITSKGGTSRNVKRPFEGIIPMLQRRLEDTTSEWITKWLSKYTTETTCEVCGGKRLNEKALSVKVGEKNIYEFTRMSPLEAVNYVNSLELSESKKHIAKLVLKEIKERLEFLVQVGLDYISLDRRSSTLSGGEAQRIRLATQIGSKLSGVLYVLDEPSIGLHPRDNDKLYQALKQMRDLGNTLIIVEHDEDIIKDCDYLIDVGPKAGSMGGEIIAAGTPSEVAKNKNSITGQYLSKAKEIKAPKKYRKLNTKTIQILKATENNLKSVDAKFYISRLNVVSGVSGSGKSSLVNECLLKGLLHKVSKRVVVPGKCKDIKGFEEIDKVIDIDQSPIGRTPRSNPATYTGLFDDIRDIFAATPLSKQKGYNKGRFSFNTKGGRCETCKGDGVTKIPMHFLPDVYVTCEACKGKRYNSETLEVKYKDKTIADVLDMDIDEALKFFENVPKIHSKLQVMCDVGIGYIKLGQRSTTLSGGEAQRVKLATELSKTITNKTLYVLDEPTTGLHSDDVDKLIKIMHRLVDQGATVVVIEHNLDVIRQADHIIDIGPTGGKNGGNIEYSGTIEGLLETQTETAKYLRKKIEE